MKGGKVMENRSESIVELAKALSKAQGMIKGAVKDSENPYFHSAYADLASVWDACREPLSKNGLSIIQTTEIIDLKPVLKTVLLHDSGEWISGTYPIIPMRQAKDTGWVAAEDPQSMGSAVTYARRYTLAAMVGIAPEDDDGEAAMGRKTEDKKPTQEPQKKIGDTPPSDLLAAVCQITNLAAKQGLKADKKTPYTLFTITGIVDGKEMIFRTFSKTISEIVAKEKNVMTIFEIKYKVTKYGNDIESLMVMEPEEEKKESAQ